MSTKSQVQSIVMRCDVEKTLSANQFGRRLADSAQFQLMLTCRLISLAQNAESVLREAQFQPADRREQSFGFALESLAKGLRSLSELSSKRGVA